MNLPRYTVILDGVPVPDDIAQTVKVENEMMEDKGTVPYSVCGVYRQTYRQRIRFGDATPLPWSHPPHPWVITREEPAP